MSKLVLALSTSLAVFALACGGAAPKADSPAGHHEDEHGTVDAKDLKPNGEAKVGEKTKCPVSGEVFTVAADSPKFEYKGKTYYTCCAGCMKKVQENPEKYLGKPAS